MIKCLKFLVLKRNVKEQENNLRHQIFRRKRYRVLIEFILEYLSIIDIVNILKLNRNISNIIKEKNLIDKILFYKNLLLKEAESRFTNFNNNKLFEINLNEYFHNNKDLEIKSKLLPIYFSKIYFNSNFISNYEFKNISLGSMGSHLLAYMLKIANTHSLKFSKILNIHYLFSSYYFKECNNLTTIILQEFDCRNYIDEISGLVEFKNLSVLKLIKCNLNNVYLNNFVISMINKNSHVRSLYLNSNMLGHNDINSIRLLLTHNSNLIHLYLDNNYINGELFSTIAKALAVNSNLETLSVSNNKIKDKDACDFFMTLWINKPKFLKTLNLSSNFISKKGIKMAGRFINRKDCPLENINLKYCYYGVDDAIKFLNKLRPNSNLTKISLLDDEIHQNQDISEFIQNINILHNLNILID